MIAPFRLIFYALIFILFGQIIYVCKLVIFSSEYLCTKLRGIGLVIESKIKTQHEFSAHPGNVVENGKVEGCVPDYSSFRLEVLIDLDDISYEDLDKKFNDTDLGGKWRPSDCIAETKIAIIIPFRNRDANLRQLLNNMIPTLRRQKVEYTVYVVEQTGESRFNRGLMKNIGFVEARKRANYDCYVFHDVDHIIESDFNLYKCKHGVAWHMATKVDRFDYKSVYPASLGGIVNFKENLFVKANGYSNFLFVWGKEDDDLWRRVCLNAGGSVERPRIHHSSITTLDHARDKIYYERLIVFDDIVDFAKKDGLNSLKYSIQNVTEFKLFTLLKVDVNETVYTEMLNNYKHQTKTTARQMFYNTLDVGESVHSVMHNEHFLKMKDTGSGSVEKHAASLNLHQDTQRCVNQPLRGRENLTFCNWGNWELLSADTEMGGRWKPKNCIASRRVAIIVPARDSDKLLNVLLLNLIPKLRRQNIDYTFFVIEQVAGSDYNGGLLKNIGFREARKHAHFDCYIFNEIDTVIESDFNTFSCKFGDVLHIGSATENNSTASFGGVVSFTEDVFCKMNGYSNFYFQNGGEDQDMYRRLTQTFHYGGQIQRPKTNHVTRLNTTDHHQHKHRQSAYGNPLYYTVFQFVHKDGLNSVQYTNLGIEKLKLITKINVDINETFYQSLLQHYLEDKSQL